MLFLNFHFFRLKLTNIYNSYELAVETVCLETYTNQAKHNDHHIKILLVFFFLLLKTCTFDPPCVLYVLYLAIRTGINFFFLPICHFIFWCASMTLSLVYQMFLPWTTFPKYWANPLQFWSKHHNLALMKPA